MRNGIIVKSRRRNDRRAALSVLFLAMTLLFALVPSAALPQVIDDPAALEASVPVSGIAWDDTNGDGIYDADEPALDGVAVTLVDGSQQDVATTQSGADGTFVFASVAPGEYVVEAQIPDGYTVAPETPAPGEDDEVGNDFLGADETGVASTDRLTVAVGDDLHLGLALVAAETDDDDLAIQPDDEESDGADEAVEGDDAVGDGDVEEELDLDAAQGSDGGGQDSAAADTSVEDASATADMAPGVPAPPILLFHEDFENVAAGSTSMLPAYVGTTGATYTGHANWISAVQCNGIILSFNSTGHPSCNSNGHLRDLAHALGVGNGTSNPNTNMAVSAYTQGNPGANQIQVETAQPLPISVTNRFIGFSINTVATSCWSNHPLLQFFLMNGTTQIPAFSGNINACANDGAFATHTTNGSVLFTGAQFGFRMRNAQGSGAGNDFAIDDIRVLDVSPTLDKEFAAGPVRSGAPVALTFTVTNTTELGAKNGWSFTDTLPTGLVVATPPGTTTNCPSGTVTAPAGATSITVGGNLSVNMVSCTVTVNVTSPTPGTFQNCAANITASVGLNPPQCTEVQFVDADFGDAPNSYGTTLASSGAHHLLVDHDPADNTAPLMLGNLVDAEADGIPGAAANGDDTSGIDDEDAVATPIELATAGPTTISVSATNDTTQPATLAGWVDLNRNGTFEASERQIVAVPANSGVDDYDLTFPEPSVAGDTYARFRLYTGTIADPLPTGVATGGEVEDYRVVGLVPPRFSCLPRAYLFQGTPNSAFGIDLVTGASTSLAPNYSPYQINAHGYNRQDDYIYGMHGAAPNLFRGVARIHADFTVEELGLPTNWASYPFLVDVTYNAGDVAADGTYWITDGNLNPMPWARIDLRPGSPTYMEVLQAGQVQKPLARSVSDWAFGADGELYMVADDLSAGATNRRLWRFNPGPSTLTDLANLGGFGPAVSPHGAQYADADGFLYVGNNNNGQIRRINLATYAVELFATGPTSATNDGAMCADTSIPIDFGDAPNTYATTLAGTGPRHAIPNYDPSTNTAPLMLGSLIDTEPDGFPGPLSNGDDTNGVDDEDAVSSPILLEIGSPTTVSVAVTNDTDQVATLAGWIDTNGNGTFDAGERQTASIPASSGLANYNLTFPAGSSTVTHARFRLFPGTVANPLPTGPASAGEVEDHRTSPAPQQTWSCTPQGLLFQGAPTDVIGIDLVTGSSSTIASAILPSNINGVGYNVFDNYVYGYSAAVNQILRIGSDGSVAQLGLPAGMPAATYVVGDVDENGHLWLSSQFVSGAGWFQVDVSDPSSPTYMQVLASGPVTLVAGTQPGADWAYVPGGGNYLYRIDRTTAQTAAVLVRFNRTTHAVSQVANLGNLGSPNLFGAVYADADGFLYGSNNDTGAIYRINVTAGTATLFAQGPSSTTNDGAMCADAFIPLDFGDAPNTYGTTLASNGPRHFIPGFNLAAGTAPLMLGSRIDAEDDGLPGVLANGDDTDNIDDEDALSSPLALPTGVSAITLTVPVTNTTGGSATLYGWIDANVNGVFQANEATSAVVPDGATSVVLNWTGLTPLPDGAQTYVRFRLTSDALVDNPATPNVDERSRGAASNGEVEDYRALVATSIPLSCDSPFIENFGTGTSRGPLPVGQTTYIWESGVPPGVGVNANVNDGEYSLVTSPNQGNAGWLSGPDRTPGDVNGRMMLVNADLSPGIFFQETFSGLSVGAIYDFSAWISNINGFAPLLPNVTFRVVDPSTGTVLTSTSTGPLPNTPTIEWNRYGLTFAATGSAVRLEMLNNGPGGEGNDLAIDDITVGRICEFGDAPDSYGTTNANTPGGGAGHVAAGPTLGTVRDTEDDGLPSVLADGDDNDNLDDEDGVASIGIVPGLPTTVDVVVSNPFAEVATLAGWIDLNGNGTFDAGERQTLTIPANSGTATYQLTFPASGISDSTYARFRVYGGAVPNPSPTGPASSGEVEDYLVPIAQVQFLKEVDPANVAILEPGDTFTYRIRARNIGTVAVPNVSFTDNLSQVVDDATYNNDATVVSGPGTVVFNAPDEIAWTGDLAPAQEAVIEYTVTIDDPPGGDAVLRNGVVGVGPGSNCVADPAVEPGCLTVVPQPLISATKTSDAGATVEPGDTVTYQFTVTNTGPAATANAIVYDDLSGVVDDAAYNNDATAAPNVGVVSFDPGTDRLLWTGPLAAAGNPGDTVTVTYTVTVNDADDMGNGVLTNVILGGGCPNPPVTDPDDPDFDPDCAVVTPVEAWTAVKSSNAVGPVTPGQVIQYSITVTNTGGVDLDDPADLPTVIDDLTEVLDDASYNGGATSGGVGTVSYLQPLLTWTGALSVAQVVVITYSVTVNDADDLGDAVLINAVTGSPNCPDPAITDPSDPDFNPDCVVIAPVEAWTAVKTSDASGPVEPGDVIGYTITVTNTGDVPVTGASITDSLVGVLDDATYNVDVDATSGSATYSAPNISWAGDLAVAQVVTITYSVTVDAVGDLGDAILANAVTGSPNCPAPAVTDPDDPDFNPDCVVIDPVQAFTVVKSSDASTPVLPGDVIEYSLTVANAGAVAYTALDPATLIDDLSGVIDDASYNNDAIATGGIVDYVAPQLTWEGPLAVGGVVTITYSVTVNDADDLGDGQLLNAVTGSSNCPAPAVTDPDDPDFNPDCVEISDVEAWAAVKTSDAASPALPGDVVTYTVTIENLGNAVVTGATVSDDLSEVLDDAMYNADGAATSGVVSYISPVISWTGNLAANAVVEFTYSVTVNGASALGDGVLTNAVTGSPNCPAPPVTDPQDPDFNPDCVTINPIEAWTVVKSSDADSPVQPGDVITYSLAIENTGATLVAGASITDDLTEVLDDAVYNGDVAANGGIALYTEPVISWTGDLVVGAVVTVTYSVTVNADGDLGDGSLVNAVTGSPNCPAPAVTDPSDPDFNPDCVTISPVEAWTATKSSDAALPVMPGDVVTYTVTLTNTGDVPVVGASITDNLSAVLDDTAYNGDIAADSGTAAYLAPIVSWSGDLAVGQVVSITYSVTVNDVASMGDGTLRNGVAGSPNCPMPPVTDPQHPDFNSDCVVIDPVEAWMSVKSSDAASPVMPGDVVTYTVTVTNTGGVDLTDPANLPSIVDDLTEVLDDAVYNGGATSGGVGTVTYMEPNLSWEGPLLVDQVVTITYSVTVNADGDLGDGVLVNAVTGSPNCPDPAVTDPTDPDFNPDCVNIDPVQAWTATKTSDAASPVMPGDVVTYTLTVENTGGTPVSGAAVDDNLSAVLDDAAYNGDAAATAGTVSYTAPVIQWTGNLAVDQVVTITYSVTVNGPGDLFDGVLRNAVTGSPNCPTPPVTDPQHPDFNADCVVIDPVEAWTATKTSDGNAPVLPGDIITYTVTIENTGGTPVTGASLTDDLAEVLDDAAYNGDAAADSGTVTYTQPVVSWSGDLAVDQIVTVTYSVTVNAENAMGDGRLVNAVTGSPNCPDPAVTDPTDPDFNPDCVVIDQVEAWTAVKTSDAADPVMPGDVVTYTVTIENTGDTAIADAFITDSLAEVLDDAAYNGDAAADSGTVTYAAPVVTWVGDLAVDQVVTVTYSVTVNADGDLGDGVLVNAVAGSPNCPIPAVTDPSDPDFNPDCVTISPVEAWTATKSSDAASPVMPGDTVTYTVTVENTGGTPVTGASITDSLAGVLDDATYNNDAVASAGIVTYAAPVVSWTGDLALSQVVTITYSVTVNADGDLGDGSLVNAVTGSPNCPDPAVTDPNDPDFNPDCVTISPVQAWTATKSSNAASPVMPGDTVTYTVTIENTGGTPVTGASITDNLSGVLDDAVYNGDASATSGSVTYLTPVVSWNGNLALGEVVTVTYSVTVNADGDLGDGVLTNAVAGSPNCPTPAVTDPTAPDFNADCVTINPVEAWTATKSSDAASPVMPGDTVTYTVTVENTGGTPVTGASITDSLAGVLDDATYNADAAASAGTVTYAAPVVSWTGDLALAQVVTITYSVTVNADGDLGDGVLTNAVAGSPNCPTPAVTDPSDPDFNPDCVTISPVEAWTATKSSDAASPVMPGDTVTYTVTVTNTGGTPVSGASIDDNLSAVLDDAAYNGDAAADSGTVSYTAPVIQWTGNLAVAQVVSITYSVTVNDVASMGDGTLRNAVTGSPNCPTPPVTDPQHPDFNSDCVVIDPVEAWMSVKSSDAASPVLPGDVVTYTVTVTNTGGVDLTDPANLPSIVDDLTEVLDDAVYNGGATSGGVGTVTYMEPNLSWEGPLLVDQVVTITYSVTVNADGDLGDGVLVNAVTGSPNCPDPAVTDPTDPDFNPDCVTISPVEAWTAVKASDANTPVLPGDTVTYTVTIENTGGVPITDAAVTDSLAAVLDDAEYNGDATATSGAVDYTAPIVTWTGGLAVDQVVTVTYSVTVNDVKSLGDGTLRNGISGSPNCPIPPVIDPQHPDFNSDCVVIDPIEAWFVVKTTDANDPVMPGDVVTYTVAIENTGGLPITGATITDDLTEVLDDAAYNADVATSSGTATYTAPEITWTGDLAVDQVVTVTYSVTVNDVQSMGDGVMVNAVSGSPDCPAPPVTDPQDPDFNPDCVTINPVEAWFAVKASDANTPVLPGDVVTYTLTIENSGGVPITDAVVHDNLSGVLEDAAYNADGSATAGTVTYVAPIITWTGNLAVDQVVTVTYSVTVNRPGDLNDGVLVNAVTGTPNCPTPATTDPQHPDFNPDCVTINPIEAWTTVKTSDAATPVVPGDTINYTITVTNTGGLPVTGATFTDDLTDVIDDAVYNGDEAADSGTVTYSEPVLTWTGDLALRQVVTITYSVTVNAAAELGDGTLRNAVAGSPNCPDPAVTDPSDPNYDADCVNIDPVRSFTVRKTSDVVDVTMPGDVVTYTIEVENTGGIDLVAPDQAQVDDDLSGVLDDATYNNDGAATNGTVTLNGETLTWIGDLLVDEVVTITYSVTVDRPITGDFVLANAVTSNGPECPAPAITDPDDPAFDPDCVVIDLLPGVRFVKTITGDIDVSELKPGDTYTYTVQAINTGQIDLTNVSFEDDFSDVLDDATFNDDATATIGSTSYSEPVLTWTGDLAVGETSTVEYTFTIDNPVRGNGVLRNAVTSDAPNSNCEPPDMVGAECSTMLPQPVVDVLKTMVSPENPRSGDVVTYRIEAHNRGGATAVDELIADDLSGVLDDAVYNDNALASSGTVTYTEPVISWTVDIDPGETVSLQYSVIVNAMHLLGDGILDNVVTGGGNCFDPVVTDPDDPDFDPDCVTRTPLPSYEAYKRIVEPESPEPGDRVVYEVEIINTSTIEVTDAEVIDNLSGVLDDAVYNGDAAASSGAVSYTQPELTWNGTIGVDETVTFTYSVTINQPADFGDARLINTITAPNCVAGAASGNATQTGTMANMDDMPEGCVTETPIPAVTFAKTVVNPTSGEAKAGDMVTYQVTVASIGTADVEGVSFTDDLSAVLAHATYLADASASTGSVLYSAPVLSWQGDLAAGEIAQVTYSVRLGANAPSGTALRNVVVGDGPGSNCPPGSADPACTVDVQVENPPMPPKGRLPFTGIAISAFLVAGLLLVLIGGGLVRARGRGRTDTQG